MRNKLEIMNSFVKLCQKTQKDLLNSLPVWLNKFYKRKAIKSNSDWVFAKGNIPVMLVAHLDTVHTSLPFNVWYSNNFDRVKADEGIGGDDRCGVYSIFYILKNIDAAHLPYVLFTTDEEIGGFGAEDFGKKNKKLNINCMIELDRKGNNDVVRYNDGNKDLANIFIEDFGFKEAIGSYTDICTLSDYIGVSGVNLSCGYYNAHTNSEFVIISEMLNTADRVVKFLNNDKYYNRKFHYREEIYFRFDNNKFYSQSFVNFGKNVLKNSRCICCNIECEEEELIETTDGLLCEDCFDFYKDEYVFCEVCGCWSYCGNDYCEICGNVFQKGEEGE